MGKIFRVNLLNQNKGLLSMSLPKYVPVMKGNPTAFTCLGNWYDIADPESVKSMFEILNRVSVRDRTTGFEEFQEALFKNNRLNRQLKLLVDGVRIVDNKIVCEDIEDENWFDLRDNLNK